MKYNSTKHKMFKHYARLNPTHSIADFNSMFNSVQPILRRCCIEV